MSSIKARIKLIAQVRENLDALASLKPSDNSAEARGMLVELLALTTLKTQLSETNISLQSDSYDDLALPVYATTELFLRILDIPDAEMGSQEAKDLMQEYQQLSESLAKSIGTTPEDVFTRLKSAVPAISDDFLRIVERFPKIAQDNTTYATDADYLKYATIILGIKDSIGHIPDPSDRSIYDAKIVNIMNISLTRAIKDATIQMMRSGIPARPLAELIATYEDTEYFPILAQWGAAGVKFVRENASSSQRLARTEGIVGVPLIEETAPARRAIQEAMARRGQDASLLDDQELRDINYPIEKIPITYLELASNGCSYQDIKRMADRARPNLLGAR